MHTKCECIAFTLPNTKLNVESWFLACTPSSAFINDWKTSICSLNQFHSIPEYIHHVSKTTDLSSIRNKEYLTVYVALQSVLQKPNSYSIQLLNATGPSVVHLVGVFPFLLLYKEPVMKMIKHTRQVVEWTGIYHAF